MGVLLLSCTSSLSEFWPQSKHEFLPKKVNFLYYAYVGICSHSDGLHLYKSNHLVTSTPPTAAWTRRRISGALPNWLDDVYLNPICSDLYEYPRFTKLGLDTRLIFPPPTLFVNPSASQSNPTFGPDVRTHPSNPISIPVAFASNLNPPMLSFCPRSLISARLQSTTVSIPSPSPVRPSHPHITNLMGPRTHQKLFGQDTSVFQATHIVSTIPLIVLHSLHVDAKIGPHKHSTPSHHLLLRHHIFQIPLTTHRSTHLPPHPTLHPMMPSQIKKTAQKSPPEVAPAPYPPFGHHPSDLSTSPHITHPLMAPQSLQTPQSVPTTATKAPIRSKSVTNPQAKKPPPRGRSAVPTKATYTIFTNDASTTSTSSLTLGSSTIASSHCQPSSLTMPTHQPTLFPTITTTSDVQPTPSNP